MAQARGADGNEVAEFYRPENGAINSGPFMLEAIDLDAGTLAFVPNPNFFGTTPILARIEITAVEDNVTATQMLKSGEYQAAYRTGHLDHGAGSWAGIRAQVR